MTHTVFGSPRAEVIGPDANSTVAKVSSWPSGRHGTLFPFTVLPLRASGAAVNWDDSTIYGGQGEDLPLPPQSNTLLHPNAMDNLLEKITDLNNLVLQGKIMDAFEKYYHQDVVMQENETAPRVGKAANRQAELDFLSKVTQFRGGRPLKVTAGPSATMVEWHYDYTHAEWGERNYRQVSVQEWKDGQIIREKFYYANA